MQLKEKVVVITGAGSGIGRSLAILLSREGAKLALNSLIPEELYQTVDLLNIDKEKILAEAFDVSNKKAVFKFAKSVENFFGHVDIIINNAGVAITGLTFEELKTEDFEWIFSINFMGVVYTTKAFLPLLRKQTGKTMVVNISSIFGIIPMVLKTPYCSTKHAIRGLTNSFRMELENTNIGVMGVYPGGIKTGITTNALKAEQQPEYTKTFNKSLKMKPEKAAKIIVNGILKNKENVIIGNDAKKAHFASIFAPFLLKKIARKTMKEFKS